MLIQFNVWFNRRLSFEDNHFGFHWNGAQCPVSSLYCKYRHIIIFVYLACQCTVNSSFAKCTYLSCLFKPSFCLLSISKLEICVSDHYIVF